jgi:hypothetical protein
MVDGFHVVDDLEGGGVDEDPLVVDGAL